MPRRRSRPRSPASARRGRSEANRSGTRRSRSLRARAGRRWEPARRRRRSARRRRPARPRARAIDRPGPRPLALRSRWRQRKSGKLRAANACASTCEDSSPREPAETTAIDQLQAPSDELLGLWAMGTRVHLVRSQYQRPAPAGRRWRQGRILCRRRRQ
jgi:hypothetical protein